jgi:hypothetical protein
MPEEIRYAENIIVGVIHMGRWCWYISPATLWILDGEKYYKAFEGVLKNKAYEDPNARFGIPIVNEATADQFLKNMAAFRVDLDYLQGIVRERIHISKLEAASAEEIDELFNDVCELYPAMIVDFDGKRLLSCYPETLPFEKYVPDNWRGEYESVLDDIPPEQRYWVIDGENYFRYFGVKD